MKHEHCHSPNYMVIIQEYYINVPATIHTYECSHKYYIIRVHTCTHRDTHMYTYTATWTHIERERHTHAYTYKAIWTHTERHTDTHMYTYTDRDTTLLLLLLTQEGLEHHGMATDGKSSPTVHNSDQQQAARVTLCWIPTPLAPSPLHLLHNTLTVAGAICQHKSEAAE